MELDRVEKPLRQLRKMLKDLAQNPPPEEVHRLRMHARRIEAVAAAFEPAAPKESRRLRKVLKPVCKAAGSVRDMDVLAADLLTLKQNSTSDSLAHLADHINALRSKSANHLLDTVDQQRKPARRRLKQYGSAIESAVSRKKPVCSEGALTQDSHAGTSAAAESLTAELVRWPALNSSNLHEFRLKVKELRYVLQVFPDSDPHFIRALGSAKDAIGQWHDWQQLARIASQVLNPDHDRDFLAQIEKAGKQKLTRALTVTNNLRTHYLAVPTRHTRAS